LPAAPPSAPALSGRPGDADGGDEKRTDGKRARTEEGLPITCRAAYHQGVLEQRATRAPVGRRSRNGAGVAALASLLALVFAAVAGADDYTREIVTGDQTAVNHAILKKTDFGALTVTGGNEKIPRSTEPLCAYFDPKERDLVITGEVMNVWRSALFEMRSNVSMFKGPRMVSLDWKRSYRPATFLRCMGERMQKSLGKDGKVLSAKQIPYPKIGDRTFAMRIVMDVELGGGRTRMMMDAVWVAQGRSEVVLLTTTRYEMRQQIQPVEVRFLRLMASRLTLSA
jgi:hypothetical protein